MSFNPYEPDHDPYRLPPPQFPPEPYSPQPPPLPAHPQQHPAPPFPPAPPPGSHGYPAGYPGHPPGHHAPPPGHRGHPAGHPGHPPGHYGPPPGHHGHPAGYPGHNAYPNYGRQPHLLVPTSGWATASLILGIVGILVGWCLIGVPSVIAIVAGHLGLAETSSGARGGRGMAVAGLILGYLAVVPGVVLFFVNVMGAITGADGP